MSFISIIYFLIFHSLILSLLAPKQSVWAIMEKATDLVTFTEEILGKFHFLNSLEANSLSTNPTKWSNTLKQFVGSLSTNRLTVFDHFVGLLLKEFLKEQLPVLTESSVIAQYLYC